MISKETLPGAPGVLPTCQLNRRGFLQALATTAGVVLLNGCGQSENGATPASSKLYAEAVGAEFKISGAQKLKSGEALAFFLPDETPALVFINPKGELKALSAKCTHAGCTVLWQNSSELFCPCHGSRFDLAGKVLNGPATAPLATYTARRQGEEVLIKTAK